MKSLTVCLRVTVCLLQHPPGFPRMRKCLDMIHALYIRNGKNMSSMRTDSLLVVVLGRTLS